MGSSSASAVNYAALGNITSPLCCPVPTCKSERVVAIGNYEETHRKHWARGDGPGLVGPHRDGPAPCCLGHIINTRYRPVIVMNLHLACSFAVGVVPHWTSWSHPLPQQPGFGWFLGERGLGPQSFYRRDPSRSDPLCHQRRPVGPRGVGLSHPGGCSSSPGPRRPVWWLLLTFICVSHPRCGQHPVEQGGELAGGQRKKLPGAGEGEAPEHGGRSVYNADSPDTRFTFMQQVAA